MTGFKNRSDSEFDIGRILGILGCGNLELDRADDGLPLCRWVWKAWGGPRSFPTSHVAEKAPGRWKEGQQTHFLALFAALAAALTCFRCPRRVVSSERSVRGEAPSEGKESGGRAYAQRERIRTTKQGVSAAGCWIEHVEASERAAASGLQE